MRGAAGQALPVDPFCRRFAVLTGGGLQAPTGSHLVPALAAALQKSLDGVMCGTGALVNCTGGACCQVRVALGARSLAPHARHWFRTVPGRPLRRLL